MAKTVKEWLETIEDPEIRAKAIANTDSDAFKRRFSSLRNSLYNAFNWGDSPEEYEYWSDFVDTL
jgi:hypothetical protein